jgi:dephospho-CoA kinase
MKGKKMKGELLLCFTGMPGSGKTTALAILKEKGFSVVEMSTAVIELMAKEGVEINNKSMRSFPTALREKHGLDIVSKLTAEKISSMKGEIAVFGIRSLKEVEYFKKHLEGRSVHLITFTLPPKERFDRIQAEHRGRKDEPKTLEEFMERERIESGWGLAEAVDGAEFAISNDGTKADLSKNIDAVIKLIREGS